MCINMFAPIPKITSTESSALEMAILAGFYTITLSKIKARLRMTGVDGIMIMGH